jgi:hypothetical protein
MIYVTIECDKCGHDESHPGPITNAVREWRRGGGRFSGRHDDGKATCYECADPHRDEAP